MDDFKRKYIEPKCAVIECSGLMLYAGSNNPKQYECNQWCRHWHLCRDREPGTYCRDKE